MKRVSLEGVERRAPYHNRVRDPCCGGDGQREQLACSGSRLVGRVRLLEAMALASRPCLGDWAQNWSDRAGPTRYQHYKGPRALGRVGTAPETCPVPDP